MRALLRIPPEHRSPAASAKETQSAHLALRLSLVISGLRCVATYLVIPILVPVVSFLGVVAAPISIALCLVAMVSGIAGVRRFWISDHRGKWIYTYFMVFVFIILAIFLATDITRLVT
jgi:prepilin signal peptidase PulO-like enzyme (type II secretory pathway)